MFIRFIFIVTLLLEFADAGEFDSLLAGYQDESELSKITKRDSSGIVEVYTRDDLEQMQAHNFLDVLETIPGVFLTRGANNLTLFSTPSVSRVPLTYARLYINDHDMTSSSFGSAYMIWGNMPIEYIDHIEVYKANSSLEFGNENAALIIRLYTKTPQRENGSKLRVVADNIGSYGTDFYNAQDLDNGVSYFAYGNIEGIKRTIYHNDYNNKKYDYKSNKDGYNIYGDIHYEGWRTEIGIYDKTDDGFIGIGTHKTPSGGNLDATHKYIHITKEFEDSYKLQLSYDKLRYDRIYVDSNGIRIANAPIINDYNLKFDDDIYSFILEKRFKSANNSLLLGGFYKYKEFEADGDYRDNNLSYIHTNNMKNALSLYSLYLEDNYDITQNTRLLIALKSDIFRYNKDVKSQNEFLARVGIIWAKDRVKLKAFYESSYIPLAFYQIYNPDNIPYKANPNINSMKDKIYTTSLQYSGDNYITSLDFIYVKSDNLLVYNSSNPNGWENSTNKSWKDFFQFNYTYKFNLENKLSLDVVYGQNSTHINSASNFGFILKAFDKYRKFDFYNSLNYKNAYSLYNIDIGSSYNFTSAIKYHYSKDLSLGIKGENIFHDSYAQAYRGVNFAIPTVDQKIWFNMEYLF